MERTSKILATKTPPPVVCHSDSAIIELQSAAIVAKPRRPLVRSIYFFSITIRNNIISAGAFERSSPTDRPPPQFSSPPKRRRQNIPRDIGRNLSGDWCGGEEQSGPMGFETEIPTLSPIQFPALHAMVTSKFSHYTRYIESVVLLAR